MTGPTTTENPPEPPTYGEIAVAAPPSVPKPDSRLMLTRLLPIVLAVGMLGMTGLVYRSGGTAMRNPMFALLPLMMLAGAVAAAISGRNGLRGSDIDDDRDGYLIYLAGLRDQLAGSAAAQRAFLRWSHPDPAALWTLVDGPRMWERGPQDVGFGSVRVGIGPSAPATRLLTPARDPARRGDPVTDAALRRFLHAHAAVPDLPVALSVLGGEPLGLDGDGERARGLLRALICQLAVLHSPDVLAIAAVVGAHPGDWDWLKWLPHHQHRSAVDGAGRCRLAYPDLASAEVDLAGRSAVLVIDDADGLRLAQAGTRGAARRLRVSATALTDSAGFIARPDYLPMADAVVCARRLAGHRDTRPGGSGRGWAGLLDIDDIDGFDTAQRWADEPAQRLCVPIGTDARGDPVRLDINEAAERGSGPHGLCVGATGSGKSEFLRTLVLGMTAQHSPQELNLVLVDFKGGATFLGFERLRHVAAIITNLAHEAPLVERMRDALAGELHRRQELLRAAGVAGIGGYRQARVAAGPPLPALPALLVIVDEFAELLHQHPDFLDTFVTLGRLGRSLGVHLLLASQRLEEGRLRGLDSHLSYRVCLKTTSAAESRIVLGSSDAHELPNTPGLGYLRTADGTLRRFQTAYVSGSCPSARPAPAGVRVFTAAPVGPLTAAATSSGRTVAQAMLERLAGHGPQARQIWLPPLGLAPALSDLRGEHGDLTVPIGVVDQPFEQLRSTLMARLSGAAGHVAVVGAPRSGKSTALHTLIAALSATHDPTRVCFYCLDFGGGALAAVRELPQVGAVAGGGQPDLVRRTVAEMAGIVARRETRRATGCGADGAVPDVFLVIDGWAALCREFEVESAITALAARGLSYGVHVMLSASRWAEVRPALRDLIGTRIELRLGDPAESELDRRLARQVPADRPGRGLTQDGRHMLMARPEGWEPLRHGSSVAPPIRLLPAVVKRAELIGAGGAEPVLGIDERELGIVTVDFGRQPHLIVAGDNECGKTSVLRTLCRELVRTRSAEQAQLLVVDYRRGLLGVVPAEHLAGYAMSAPALTALLPGLIERLTARMPGSELDPQQLRDRVWWSGPQLYVLVDDYDLVAGGAGNPLAALLDYLPYAGDIGLHVVVARRGDGSGRSMYEPLLAALQSLGAMRLSMSGDTADAPLSPARPVVLPPGRGTLITRADGEWRIQVAWEP
ncbi:type VII secretion protein EccCb [Mycolicibacter minnesotensis]